MNCPEVEGVGEGAKPRGRGNCPQCDKELAREPQCHSCSTCGGVWFAQDEALRYFGMDNLSADQAAAADGMLERSGGRACPACGLAMSHIEPDPALVLDRCGRCGGLFFDAGECLALRSRLAAGHGGPLFRAKVIAALVHSAGPYR